MKIRGQLSKLSSMARRDGWRSTARLSLLRLSEEMANWLSWADFDLPLREDDVADSIQMSSQPPDPAPGRGRIPLHIGWVCAPPAGGSGGHTTLFRMVQAMEKRGHRCTLFLYDRNTDDVERHVGVIRSYWPWIQAEIRSALPAIDNVDAVVASSWPSAHVVATKTTGPPHRFYFIQDYEPYFHPRGALYALAEDTYRFGFTNIALGEMVASSLLREVGAAADAIVPFGCDTDVYRLLPAAQRKPRNGVVVYVKKTTDRRGYLLGKMALEQFHRQHPEQEIHAFGEPAQGWSVPVTNHGTLSPRELNELYNQTITGLALSFTNISLTAEEMLASGTIPVINDSPMSRADLHHSEARWAAPTPSGIASVLGAVIRHHDVDGRAQSASRKVRSGWAHTGELVAKVIEDRCASPQPPAQFTTTVSTSPDSHRRGQS